MPDTTFICIFFIATGLKLTRLTFKSHSVVFKVQHSANQLLIMSVKEKSTCETNAQHTNILKSISNTSV